MAAPLRVHYLGLQDYTGVWQAMSTFTSDRQVQDDDQLWVLQHQSVFTQGQAGKAEHVLNPGKIPVVQSDRGGQVTYHGPGQIVVYPLINLKQRRLSVRDMVTALELTAVNFLSEYSIQAYPKASAPGVYVHCRGREAKIASLGLRVRRSCSFHGMSVNIDANSANPWSPRCSRPLPGLATSSGKITVDACPDADIKSRFQCASFCLQTSYIDLDRTDNLANIPSRKQSR